MTTGHVSASDGESRTPGVNSSVGIFAVALTFTHRYNAVRGHRTGSNNSKEWKLTPGSPSRKTNKTNGHLLDADVWKENFI